MCIELWRRYFCPKAPNWQPLAPPLGARRDHPWPLSTVPDHHLQWEEHDIFRENAHDPSLNLPNDQQVHWAISLIRCAHLHAEQCNNNHVIGTKIQYINTACPYCTGNIDMHVERHNLVIEEHNLHPHIPQIDQPDEQLDRLLEGYREYYLVSLLSLILQVLMKAVPKVPGGNEWEAALSVAWPETFCKLHRNHHEFETDGSSKCDCLPMKEEWRANSAFTMRKNEADALMDAMNEAEGEIWRYWMDLRIFRENDGTLSYGVLPTTQATNMWQNFPADGFPTRQMEFVNLPEATYIRRINHLQGMSLWCRDLLEQRGQAVSESVPPNTFPYPMPWMGLDDWSASLGRRKRFVDWVYHFLARDAGLDDEVMVYIGGALLAMLNPWPNGQYNDHPSHRAPYVLDPQMAAWDLLQECMWWVEYQWPIDARGTMVNLRRATEETTRLLDVIQRNRSIALEDSVARGRAIDTAAQTLGCTPAEADAEGAVCLLCREGWGAYPNHGPVRLPCCSAHVGLRCLKRWLGRNPIRGADSGEDETWQTWAAEWTCVHCKQGMGREFAPDINQGFASGPWSLRGYNFCSLTRAQPQSTQYWNLLSLLQSQQNLGG